MTEPTEADRAKAAELCIEMPSGIDVNDIFNTAPFREQVEFVAAALAEERERARAPFLALADEYERRCEETWRHQREAISYDWDLIANRIRRAARETL